MTDPIETTVDRLRAELGGHGQARASVLTEVRDGLEDAALAYADAGLAEPDARRRAVTDFGDPSTAARQYRAAELGRRSLRTAALLGLGFTLSLLAWAVYGFGQGNRMTLDGANLSFALVTALAVAAAVLGCWWTRWQLRRGQHPRAATLAVATSVLTLCVATWLLSYAVHPWTTPAEIRRTGWQWHHAAEAVSAIATGSMLMMALSCLAAVAANRLARPAPAGRG